MNSNIVCSTAKLNLKGRSRVVRFSISNFCNKVQFSTSMAQPGTFLYFAFGSNLWTKRIHENNPSAKMVSVAKLNGYKLEFGYWATRWRGAAANILPDPDSHVYGVLWELNQTDQASLDKYAYTSYFFRQEGVFDNIYQRKEVLVEMHPEGKPVNCMAYQIREETRQKAIEVHGEKLIPSLVYKNVILEGAREHGLPEQYVKMLEAIQDNGYNGEVDVNVPLALVR